MDLEGIHAIWKPVNIRSFPFIHKIRKYLKKKYSYKGRIGHGGTLDEKAEGIMIVAIGRQNTKLLGEYQCGTKHGNKTYIVSGTFGMSSPSFDTGTDITLHEVNHISKKAFVEVMNSFKKTFNQMPPIYSSKKINGKLASDLARAGKEVKLKPKEITIFNIKLCTYDFPNFMIEVECSGGTYMRSIIRDIGENLKIPCIMSSLTRTSSGEFAKTTLEIDFDKEKHELL